MPNLRSTCAAVSVALLATAVPAQFQPGDVVVTNFSPPGVFAITPGLPPVAVTPTVPLAGPSGVAATSLGEVVIADFNGRQLVLVQPSGAASVVAANLGGCLRVVEDVGGDFLVSTAIGLERVTRAGVVSTIVANGGPIGRVFGVAVDGDGTYLVADDRNDALHRVTPQGVVTTLHAGAPFALPQGVAILADGNYAVYDGLTDSVFRVDRATSAVTTFVASGALGGNPCGITASFDGGLLVSQSSAALNQVVAIDPTGAVTPIAVGGPFTNLEDVTRVRHLTGPSRLQAGPGGLYSLDLEFPSNPQQFYGTALSATLYPGFVPFAADPRSFSLALDPFFAATVGVNALPVLAGWAGFLDAQGRAAIGIDLRALPSGALVGLTFYVQSFSLPMGSAASVSSYSNVHPVVF